MSDGDDQPLAAIRFSINELKWIPPEEVETVATVVAYGITLWVCLNGFQRFCKLGLKPLGSFLASLSIPLQGSYVFLFSGFCD